MRHEEVQQYLEDYARHFNLLKHIKFTTLVERVHPVMVSPQNGKVTWEVTVRELEGGTTSTAKYDAVMVCNGYVHTSHSVSDISNITFNITLLY